MFLSFFSYLSTGGKNFTGIPGRFHRNTQSVSDLGVCRLIWDATGPYTPKFPLTEIKQKSFPMQTYQTFNGNNSDNEPTRSLTVVVNNDSASPKKVVLVHSNARCLAKTVGVVLMEDSDHFVLENNPFFSSLAELRAFVQACPTRLHTIAILPLTSGNLLEQTTKAVRILTPAFGREDLTENIQPVPIAGGSSFLLPDFYLGLNAEAEITVQPMTIIHLTLQFGYYHTDRLVPIQS